VREFSIRYARQRCPDGGDIASGSCRNFSDIGLPLDGRRNAIFCLWVIKVEGTAPTFEEFAAVTIRNAGYRNRRQYLSCGPRKRELNTSGVSTKSILANRSPSNSNVSHSRSGWLERSWQGHQPLPRRHCPSWPDLCVRTSWGSTESRSALTRISAGPGTNIDWGGDGSVVPDFIPTG
jgi:hypothetical protein